MPAASKGKRPPRLGRALAYTLAAGIIGPASALAYFSWTAFDPPPSLALSPHGTAATAKPARLSLLTWNLGYAGLDRETDFFMDGGHMAAPRSQAAVEHNLRSLVAHMRKLDADVMFLQEVDRASSRTFDIDQVAAVLRAFPSHQAAYGINFQSPFVPVPVTSPIGRVKSGVLTLSRARMTHATREQLPGRHAWPVRLFHLQRCAVFTHIPSARPGKDWVLVNIHLSAFDDGSLRAQQSAYVRARMLELFEQGHFVIVGGDWNMTLPGVAADAFGPSTTTKDNLAWLGRVPQDWTPAGWTWAIDGSVPTARTNDQPYREGENHRMVIDGFVVSPNVDVRQVRGIDLGFAHSDHQPVVVTVAMGDA